MKQSLGGGGLECQKAGVEVIEITSNMGMAATELENCEDD